MDDYQPISLNLNIFLLIFKTGSFTKAKEVGKWRLEGKEHIVKDGDIISVRHS